MFSPARALSTCTRAAVARDTSIEHSSCAAGTVSALALHCGERRRPSRGSILGHAARCRRRIAYVWSHLLDGEPHFTLSQVALNDLREEMEFHADPRTGAVTSEKAG
jgi:hypothetical protein